MTTPRPSLNRAIGYSLAATLVYLAAVVAGFGMVSLFSDEEVIDIDRAGVLLGPIAVAVTGLFFALVALRALHRDTAYAGPRGLARVGTGIGVGILIWVLYAAVIAAGVIFGSGPTGRGGTEFVHALIRPFAPTAGVLAAVVLIGMLFLSAAAGRGTAPVRWTWEKDDEDGPDLDPPGNR